MKLVMGSLIVGTITSMGVCNNSANKAKTNSDYFMETSEPILQNTIMQMIFY